MTSMPQLYLCWGSGGGPLQYTNTLVSLALCMQPSPASKIRQSFGCKIRGRVRASVAIGELHQKRVGCEVVPHGVNSLVFEEAQQERLVVCKAAEGDVVGVVFSCVGEDGGAAIEGGEVPCLGGNLEVGGAVCSC